MVNRYWGNRLVGCLLCLLPLIASAASDWPDSVIHSSSSQTSPSYQQVKPLLAQRCVVCHACYDAPCQLKLEAHEGLIRGVSKDLVYDGFRLKDAPTTRLFEDAQTETAWRQKGFHSVLAEGDQLGLLARMLELKRQQTFPTHGKLGSDYDFSVARDQQCATTDEFNRFARKYPNWGMPYGLPALSDSEHEKILNWLQAGAPGPEPAVLTADVQQQRESWERWLNGDSLKQRLVSRYLYEHLFLAHLYFPEQGQGRGQQTRYFRIVRSTSPPGQPFERIATRRPYDDPGVPRVYYRLWLDPTTVVDKTHMPYALTDKRKADWQRWFIDADYAVTELPGYEPEQASNPFITFQPIPPSARHRFLLDEAEFTIMNFIKGPVCRGNIALSVIQDDFWVFFVTPETFDDKSFSRFLAQQDQFLSLPAASAGQFLSIAQWLDYSRSQQRYLAAKADYMRKRIKRGTIDKIWDGEGVNKNAALTIFRHKDTATVVKGMVGQPPLTAWVIDYPILERIHYLLVAGFDVFGSVSHQAMTRMYMDFLRMESEMNFLAFLPEESRNHEVARWYQGAMSDVATYLQEYFHFDQADAGQGAMEGVANYLQEYFRLDKDAPRQVAPVDNHKLAFYDSLREHLAAVLDHSRDIESAGFSPEITTSLQRLQQLRGGPASILPETLFIDIEDGGVLTLIGNRSFTNISSMFEEDQRRLPAEDSLTLVKGFLGAYPHGFIRLKKAQLPDFVEQVSQLQNEQGYEALLDRYGVRRTNPDFWQFSDHLHDEYRQLEPLNAGVLDYSRLENR